MSTLKVDTQSLIPAKQPYPPGAGSAAEAVTKHGGPMAPELASAIRNFDAWLKKLQSTLQNQSPVVEKIAVVDSTGKVIAAIGDFIFNGVPSTNYFSEIHVGDPLNTGDPSQALFNANTDGSVTVGQHGWLQVLDPFEADAAWIGTQFDVFTVTGAVAGAASGTVNLIRLTVTGHTLLTGDVVQVREVVGVTSATDGTSNANGTWTVTKIDANHVDLQNSVFVGTYTSGGTIWRLLHVTGASNNGSGLIRLTVLAHGYESGDAANVQSVGGVPNATGQWTVEVVNANTFDLVGSTFAGAYTSGGTSLRYFAGGLFQTIAIGPSFVDYRLRAFRDGTLKLRNAEIIISGTGADIVIDPVTGTITVTQTGGGRRVTIGGLGIVLDDSTGSPPDTVTFTPSGIQLNGGNPDLYQINLATGGGVSLFAPTGSFALSKVFDLFGYSAATPFGPVISFTQLRGSGASPTATQSGDTLGGIVAYGFDGIGESNYAAGVRAEATQAHSAGAQGAKVVVEATPNGSNTPATVLSVQSVGIDTVGNCNVSGVYQKGGFSGLSTTVTLAKLTALGFTGSMTFSGGILTAYTPPT